MSNALPIPPGMHADQFFDNSVKPGAPSAATAGLNYPEGCGPAPAPPTSNPIFHASDFTVIDCETTGFDPETNDIVEVAAMRFINGVPQRPLSTFVQTPLVMPAVAEMVHQISNQKLFDVRAPFLEEVAPAFQAYVGDSLVVAHNARFDKQFINPRLLQGLGVMNDQFNCVTPPTLRSGPEWLCTLELGRKLYPQAGGYTNTGLAHWLGVLPRESTEGRAHEALYDVKVTANLFVRMMGHAHALLDIRNLNELKAYVQAPRALPEMDFGKHQGQPLDKVPSSWLSWAIKLEDLPMYRGVAIAAELERRGMPVKPAGVFMDVPPHLMARDDAKQLHPEFTPRGLIVAIPGYNAPAQPQEAAKAEAAALPAAGSVAPLPEPTPAAAHAEEAKVAAAAEPLVWAELAMFPAGPYRQVPLEQVPSEYIKHVLSRNQVSDPVLLNDLERVMLHHEQHLPEAEYAAGRSALEGTGAAPAAAAPQAAPPAAAQAAPAQPAQAQAPVAVQPAHEQAAEPSVDAPPPAPAPARPSALRARFGRMG